LWLATEKKTTLLESFHSKSITWAKYYLGLHLKHFLDEYSECGRCGVEMALRSGVRGGSREPEAWACGEAEEELRGVGL
jgi:hypothetical protein